MAAVHHPKPERLALEPVRPEYQRMAKELAAGQGMTLSKYVTQKFLDGLRNDLIAQEMAQPLPDTAELLQHKASNLDAVE